MSKKQKLVVFLVTFVIGFSFFSLVKADMYIPMVTNVYFKKDQKPYSKPVSFTVNCYGRIWRPGEPQKEPGTYAPEKIYSVSATCPNYGCKVYNMFPSEYTITDYCNLVGNAEGKQFKVDKFSTNLFSNCSSIPESQQTEKDNEGRILERKCTLSINMPSSFVPGTESTGFFNQIRNFFRRLFGKG